MGNPVKNLAVRIFIAGRQFLLELIIESCIRIRSDHGHGTISIFSIQIYTHIILDEYRKRPPETL